MSRPNEEPQGLAEVVGAGSVAAMTTTSFRAEAREPTSANASPHAQAAPPTIAKLRIISDSVLVDSQMAQLLSVAVAGDHITIYESNAPDDEGTPFIVEKTMTKQIKVRTLDNATSIKFGTGARSFYGFNLMSSPPPAVSTPLNPTIQEASVSPSVNVAEWQQQMRLFYQLQSEQQAKQWQQFAEISRSQQREQVDALRSISQNPEHSQEREALIHLASGKPKIYDTHSPGYPGDIDIALRKKFPRCIFAAEASHVPTSLDVYRAITRRAQHFLAINSETEVYRTCEALTKIASPCIGTLLALWFTTPSQALTPQIAFFLAIEDHANVNQHPSSIRKRMYYAMQANTDVTAIAEATTLNNKTPFASREGAGLIIANKVYFSKEIRAPKQVGISEHPSTHFKQISFAKNKSKMSINTRTGGGRNDQTTANKRFTEPSQPIPNWAIDEVVRATAKVYGFKDRIVYPNKLRDWLKPEASLPTNVTSNTLAPVLVKKDHWVLCHIRQHNIIIFDSFRKHTGDEAIRLCQHLADKVHSKDKTTNITVHLDTTMQQQSPTDATCGMWVMRAAFHVITGTPLPECQKLFTRPWLAKAFPPNEDDNTAERATRIQHMITTIFNSDDVSDNTCQTCHRPCHATTCLCHICKRVWHAQCRSTSTRGTTNGVFLCTECKNKEADKLKPTCGWEGCDLKLNVNNVRECVKCRNKCCMSHQASYIKRPFCCNKCRQEDVKSYASVKCAFPGCSTNDGMVKESSAKYCDKCLRPFHSTHYDASTLRCPTFRCTNCKKGLSTERFDTADFSACPAPPPAATTTTLQPQTATTQSVTANPTPAPINDMSMTPPATPIPNPRDHPGSQSKPAPNPSNNT
jgi:hypothetical protein